MGKIGFFMEKNWLSNRGLTLILALFFSNLWAQDMAPVEIKSKERKGINKAFYIIKPLFQLDARRSLYQQKWVKTNGFRLGFEMFEKHRFGLGFYTTDPVKLSDEQIGNNHYNVQLSFNYVDCFFEYIALRNYRWEAYVQSAIGFGKGEVKILDKSTETIFASSTPSIPVHHFGLGGEYKVLPFLGLGAGLGYRNALINPDDGGAAQIKKAFNAPFYFLRLKIHLGQLYKFLFNRKQYKIEKEEYLESKKEKNRQNQ